MRKQGKALSRPPQTRRGIKKLEIRFLNAVVARNLIDISQCLAMGVNPNLRAHDRNVTPLHIAAERGDYVLGVRLTMCKDIDLNTITDHSYTALHIAVMFGKRKIVRMLLERGANVNVADRMGLRALHYAVRFEAIGIVRELLRHDADANALDCFENSALSIALLDVQNVAIARLLVESGGADVDLNRPCQRHLFLDAVFHCNSAIGIDVVNMLVSECGCDVNMIDRRTKRNCLHFVALTGYLDMAKVLLDYNVNLTVYDRNRQTPLMIAKEHEFDKLVDLFQEKYTDLQSFVVVAYNVDIR